MLIKKSTVLAAGILFVIGVAAAYLLQNANRLGTEVPLADDGNRHTRPCGKLEMDSADLQLRCYWVITESRGRFNLPVAVISQSSSDTALLHIAGGPGDGDQTNAASLQEWLQWYKKSGLSADLVLYSPRGTPGAGGSFLCEAYEQISWQFLDQNLSLEDELALSDPVVAECLAQYSNALREIPGVPHDYPLQTFGSHQQAQDALHILAELGYQQWHLWGVSYGTRVAMVAADQARLANEQRLKSLILDSPYPPGKGSLSDWPSLLENAFTLHETRKPGFRELWRQVMQAFNNNPQARFLLENWHYNLDPCQPNTDFCYQHRQQVPFYLNKSRLLGLSYYVLYDETLLESFYVGLQQLQEAIQLGEPLTANFELELVMESFLASAFAPSFSPWVFFATECTDNGLVTAAEVAAAQQHYPQWQQQLEVEYRYNLCRDTRFFKPEPALAPLSYYPMLPAMILVGEFDPVTPVNWARELATQHSEYSLIVAENTGHSVLFSNYCAEDALAQWLAQPGTVACRHGD